MAITKALEDIISTPPKLQWQARILGDGSTTTVKCPLTRAEKAWTQPIDEAAGFAPQLSCSGQTITYGAAPSNGKYHWLFVSGF